MKLEYYKYQKVPKYITEGYHSQYIQPIAKKLCQGKGVDIGCKNYEWAFPGATPIDLTFDNEYHALNLPNTDYDYIFSSHCLEHLDNYIEAITYWKTCLKSSGILFLYLPHPDCLYWQPTEMPSKLHKHILTPFTIKECLEEAGFKNIFYSERDLAYSFAIFGENNG